MPWTVYIVRCSDGSFYTGIAKDVARRIDKHNRGRGAAYTRSRRPVTLVYQERKRSRVPALLREIDIKRLTRAEKEALIARGRPFRSARRASKIQNPWDKIFKRPARMRR